MGDEGCYCFMCVGCCGIITGLIILAMSFATLPINTWGLDYNGIGKTVSQVLMDAGVHVIGPLHRFIQYPITQQTFSFRSGGVGPAISARTMDGLMVTFNAEFQYQFVKSDLYKLYMKFGEDSKNPCSRYAIDVLNDSASKQKASSFFK